MITACVLVSSGVLSPYFTNQADHNVNPVPWTICLLCRNSVIQQMIAIDYQMVLVITYAPLGVARNYLEMKTSESSLGWRYWCKHELHKCLVENLITTRNRRSL